MKGYSEKAGKIAIATVDAILQMSDRAERLGGAKSIAGVAALHQMQTSIQAAGKKLGEEMRKALDAQPKG